jgi:hypothetical protein
VTSAYVSAARDPGAPVVTSTTELDEYCQRRPNSVFHRRRQARYRLPHHGPQDAARRSLPGETGDLDPDDAVPARVPGTEYLRREWLRTGPVGAVMPTVRLGFESLTCYFRILESPPS